jgi:hypothetical protein
MVSTFERNLLAIPLLTLVVNTTAALHQITPPAPIQVTPIITINNSPGDQTQPHLNKDRAAYTDSHNTGSTAFCHQIISILLS